MQAWVVDDASSEQRLDLAAAALADCSGTRCEEEYKVLLENAARALASSRLGRRLPDRPLRWVVVEDSER